MGLNAKLRQQAYRRTKAEASHVLLLQILAELGVRGVERVFAVWDFDVDSCFEHGFMFRTWAAFAGGAVS